MIIPDYIKDYILKSVGKNNKLSALKLKKYSTKEIQEWISQYSNYTFKHIYYIIKNNINDIPLCPVCGSKVFNCIYGKIYCSTKCSNSSIEVKEKIKNINLKKYGVEYSSQNKDIRNKQKKTCLKKYGFESPLSSETIKEKSKISLLEKYGTDNYSKTNEFKEKSKKTFIDRYGVDNPLKSEEIKEKIKNANIEKYGVDNYSKTNEFKEKVKNTNIERYGVKSFSLSKEYKLNQRKKRYPIFLKQIESTNIELLSSEEEFINSEQIRYKCKLCGTEFTLDKSNIQLIHCPNRCTALCSIKEHELHNFIQSIISNKIICNTRSIINPLELDIYIPDKNLAIEFNGDYWHSSERKDKNYHLEKTLKCQEKEIRLIHIFEHEWDFKRPIVESILRNALGSIENRIYARKCFVLEISQKEYSNFLELNHIQGSIISKYRYGLFYNSELVSVIGFGSSRFKKGEIELHRFCSKVNTSVIGGFSKLIKYFMEQNICSEFITYVDRSKFDAFGYFKIGFELLSESVPSYFYIKDDKVLSRYQCQKHKLAKLLENYEPSLSESDNMILNGYLKVYDCGTMKLIYRK